MRVSGGIKESGIEVGNTYDKYNSRNPIVRRLMSGFDSALSELVMQARPQSIHEVGCGEGFWTLKWLEKGLAARGSDFSEHVIDIARANARERNQSPEIFNKRSIYDLKINEDAAHLIVCCEVLEHLEDPEQALEVLRSLAQPYVILSVPREPLWRFLNMMRGKYWTDLGNTPGHIQHWSKSKFESLISRHFDILAIRSPTPWTMLLCKTR